MIFDKKILLMHGGGSEEAHVSNKSADAISKVLEENNYKFERVNPKDSDFIEKINQKEELIIFNALHGGAGEDGTFAAFFDVNKIPYTHSGMEASVTGMNKFSSNIIAEKIGLNKNSYIYIRKDSLELIKTEKKFQRIIANDYFIKPINFGSSIGIQYIEGGGIEAIDRIDWDKYSDIIVEAKITGREFNVGIYKNKAIGIAEIEHESEFFDAKTKNNMGREESKKLLCNPSPKKLPIELENELKKHAEYFHNYLGCNFISRIEFIYGKEVGSEEDKLYFLEINTHPGLANSSIYPSILESMNIKTLDLIEGLLSSAKYKEI